MKTGIFVSASLMSAFILSVGCAADTSSENASTASDSVESEEALTSRNVIGKYVRKEHFGGCDMIGTIDLQAGGRYVAIANYSGPNVDCGTPSLPVIRTGCYTLNRSNVMMLKADGQGRIASTFQFALTRGDLSFVGTRTSFHSESFQGVFRKLTRNECRFNAECGGGRVCSEGYAPNTAASIGKCVVPESSASCGGLGGLSCPQDTWCDDRLPNPFMSDESFQCRPIRAWQG